MILVVQPQSYKKVRCQLYASPNVTVAEFVDGSQDLAVVTEASSYEELVSRTVDALIEIEDDIKEVRFLPTQTDAAHETV